MCVCVCIYIYTMCAKLLPSCLTLCEPMDCSSPGYSVHAVLQARILEWGCHALLQGIFLTRNWTCISYVSYFGRLVLYHWRNLGNPYIEMCIQNLSSLHLHPLSHSKTFSKCPQVHSPLWAVKAQGINKVQSRPQAPHTRLQTQLNKYPCARTVSSVPEVDEAATGSMMRNRNASSRCCWGIN